MDKSKVYHFKTGPMVILVLSDRLNIDLTLPRAQRAKLKWEYIEKHPDEEHWDYAEHYGFRGRVDLAEHTSSWEGIDKDTLVSTKGRYLKLYQNKIPFIFEFTKKLKERDYYRFTLEGKNYLSHRVIASTFIPSGDNDVRYLMPNHKSGVRWDNSVFNLEWVTVQENNIHAIETELNKTNCYLLTMVVPNIFEGRQFVLKSSAELTTDLNIRTSTLYSVLTGRYKTIIGCSAKVIPKSEMANYDIGIPDDIKELYLKNKAYFHPVTKPVLGTVLSGPDKGYQFALVGQIGKFRIERTAVTMAVAGKIKSHRNCSWKSISLKEAMDYPQAPPDSIFEGK